MSRFVGGIAQAQFVAQVRDLPREQCLVVAVDVGKRTALALIADHFGMVIGPAVPFTMNEVGIGALTSRIHTAAREACAVSVRGRGGVGRLLPSGVGGGVEPARF